MNNDTLTLYHVGFYKLPRPDIHFGDPMHNAQCTMHN